MKLTSIVSIVPFLAAVATFLMMFAGVGAASAMTASCVGAPSTTSITWTASASGGVNPVAFLWGNGSTSSVQTIAETPGTYSMTIQATDASSSVATSSCMAMVSAAAPSITSFTVNPANITSGQSSVLSWVVNNASTTSIDNGVGVVTGASVTVLPTVTTTYNLTAANSAGTSTASATVTVGGTSGVAAQIQALLQQIAALQAQLMQLIQQRGGGGTGTATSTPPTMGCSFSRDLGEGDSGDDVKALQSTLTSDPSILPSNLITGFFGPLTKEAIIKFQQKFGIASSSTGFFGPKTRGYLKEHCGEHNGWVSVGSTTLPFGIAKKMGEDGGHSMGMPGTSTQPFMTNNEHGGGNRGGPGRNGGDN